MQQKLNKLKHSGIFSVFFFFIIKNQILFPEMNSPMMAIVEIQEFLDSLQTDKINVRFLFFLLVVYHHHLSLKG
jgi:hypothetical protein